MKTRISEHRNEIKCDEPKSELARHGKSHKIIWRKPKIINIEKNFRSRLFYEMHTFIEL